MTTKLGIRLVAAYHYLGGVICILMALIVAFIAITTLTTSSDTPLDTIILILVAVVCAIFAAIFFKIARLTRELQPNGWWTVMILNAVFLLAADPLAAVILLYMYIMRRDFGIERGFTEIGDTEDFIRKLTGVLASLAVFPGLGQIVVGRLRLGKKLSKMAIVIGIVLLGVLCLTASGVLPWSITAAVFILGIIAMFGIWIYALINVIVEGVVPNGGEDEQ
jgi:hypothetical protein